MIIPLKNKPDCKLIRYQNKTQLDKYNIFENHKIVYHDYKVEDKVMLNNTAA